MFYPLQIGPFSASEAVSFLFFFLISVSGNKKGPRERIDFIFFSEKKVMVGLEELCLPFFLSICFCKCCGAAFPIVGTCGLISRLLGSKYH